MTWSRSDEKLVDYAVGYLFRRYYVSPAVEYADVRQEARIALFELRAESQGEVTTALCLTCIGRRLMNFLRNDYRQRRRFTLGWTETQLENCERQNEWHGSMKDGKRSRSENGGRSE